MFRNIFFRNMTVFCPDVVSYLKCFFWTYWLKSDMFCIFQANYGGGSSEPCQVSELGSQSAATGQVSGTNNREYIFTVLG